MEVKASVSEVLSGIEMAEKTPLLCAHWRRSSSGSRKLLQRTNIDRGDQFLEARGGNARDRASRQYAVGNIGAHVGRAGFQQSVGRIAQGAAVIDDIVDEDAILALHTADDVHDF